MADRTSVSAPTIEFDGVVHSGKRILKAKAYVTPFICRHCDQTHINIDFPGTEFTMLLSASQFVCEMLAAKVVNPFLDPTAE